MAFVYLGSAQDATTSLTTLVQAPAMTRVLYPRGKPQGLEPAALQVLVTVKLLNAPTVREIESALAMSHGTVTTALGVLQGKGLVRDRADESDARARRQTITASGTRLVNEFQREALGRLNEARGERS